MSLTDNIESAEHQFKKSLEDFFINVYDEKPLLSHGIDHHRRVWSYSKELLTLLVEKKGASLLNLPHKLIIASYLHDIGMSVETGILHGKHGRDLATQFLKKNNLSDKDYYDVLEAIENHDKKDYTSNTSTNNLLTILSVADDLDAFSFTGIFRYLEIYLTRRINPEEIGHQIVENATMRYDNFIKTFGFNDALIFKHKKRFNTLTDFFSEYNKQISTYRFGKQKPSGYCGVADTILNLLKKRKELITIFTEAETFSDDPVLLWFFNGLEYELS